MDDNFWINQTAKLLMQNFRKLECIDVKISVLNAILPLSRAG